MTAASNDIFLIRIPHRLNGCRPTHADIMTFTIKRSPVRAERRAPSAFDITPRSDDALIIESRAPSQVNRPIIHHDFRLMIVQCNSKPTNHIANSRIIVLETECFSSPGMSRYVWARLVDWYTVSRLGHCPEKYFINGQTETHKQPRTDSTQCNCVCARRTNTRHRSHHSKLSAKIESARTVTLL